MKKKKGMNLARKVRFKHSLKLICQKFDAFELVFWIWCMADILHGLHITLSIVSYGTLLNWLLFSDLIMIWTIIISDSKSDEKNYCDMQWCDGYGMLLLLTVLVYICLFYFNIIKPLMSKCLRNSDRPRATGLFSNRYDK